jgi:hypothetical protein
VAQPRVSAYCVVDCGDTAPEHEDAAHEREQYGEESGGRLRSRLPVRAHRNEAESCQRGEDADGEERCPEKREAAAPFTDLQTARRHFVDDGHRFVLSAAERADCYRRKRRVGRYGATSTFPK